MGVMFSSHPDVFGRSNRPADLLQAAEVKILVHSKEDAYSQACRACTWGGLLPVSLLVPRTRPSSCKQAPQGPKRGLFM